MVYFILDNLEYIMKKRTLVSRICPECKKEELVRKDGAGKWCRTCRAKENSKKKVGRYKDIANQRFGRLVAQSVSHQVKKTFFWNCLCDCSNKCIVSGSRLRSGQTKSCGCLTKSQKGLSATGAYRSWDAMNQRCYDKNVPHYQRYGARGITVCDRWKKSFLNFLEDMGTRPFGKTLDRIDNNGNYCKENCKWSTYSEQALNQRKRNAKAKKNSP